MKNFPDHGDCPVRHILSRISSKWAMLLLLSLDANGTMRFGEIQRSLGDVSQRMLTLTLRTLEEDGLISRRAYAEVPPRVEYALTERADDLMPLLKHLVAWAIANGPEIIEHRQAHR